MTIIYFIIALSSLVLIHEWGHFFIARRAGIRVEVFSIGFGPRLFSLSRGGTEYRISALPFGGYVKLFGEDPVAEAEGDDAKAREIAQSPEAFSGKSIVARLLTVLAGPGMNLVLALVLMPVVFMIGRQQPAILDQPPVIIGLKERSPAVSAGLSEGDRILKIDGKEMEDWSEVLDWIILHPDSSVPVQVQRGAAVRDFTLKTITSPISEHPVGYAGFEPLFFFGNSPVVGEVSNGSAASRAGLKPGDRILSVNDKPTPYWSDLTDSIRASSGSQLRMIVQRGEEQIDLTVTPEFNEGYKAWLIGISKQIDNSHFVHKRYGFLQALDLGLKENIRLFTLTGDVLYRLIRLELSYKTLGGPLQIAQATGMAAEAGVGEFLFFLCFLSLQLGVLNLLPIPVLDGGHILFMGIEAIRRKPVSLKFRNALTQVGFVLLVGLMILITINDVDRIWGFGEIFGKLKGIF